MKKIIKDFIFIVLSILKSPRHLKIIIYDVFMKRFDVFENRTHLKAAMDWLRYAQDISPDGGVSAGYLMTQGWQPSHRETTGYIIPTFFDYYNYSGIKNYFTRALRMADWELRVQLENGAIPFGCAIGNTAPLIFDTGQVIFGWVRAYKETGDDRYKKAAEKAADWIVKMQDEDGCWRKFVFNEIPHTYYIRVAWALLELSQISENIQFVNSAKKNIGWTLSNQLDNGWFKQCAFQNNGTPTTHTLAYAIDGLLESGLILDDKGYIEKAKISADALLAVQKEDGSLSGIYDSDWNGAVKWSCLTGDAQISIIWLRLYQLTGDDKYLTAAKKAISYLTGLQDIKTKKEAIRGAIKGSHPIWGGYNPFSYMNWMTKFFVDALLLEEDIRRTTLV